MIRRLGASAPPPTLVLAAIVSVQVGSAIAALLVSRIGAPATVMLRLVIAAGVLLLASRPSLRGRTRRQWGAVLAFAISLGLMNLAFYEALARLPLGVVVTVEFLGPLALSAALSRRPRDAAAVAAAVVGVVLISEALSVPWDRLDHVGLAAAAVAGASWAAYILCSRSVGRHFAELDGLSLAMMVAAALVLPLGIARVDIQVISLPVLAGGAMVALLSSVLPYSLELMALRRMDPRVFGILLSLEPAMAALAGFVILGQLLAPAQLAGMSLVAAASLLVMGSQRPSVDEEAAEIG